MDYMKVIPSSISEAIPKPGKLILISYFFFVLRLSVAVLTTSETLQCINQQVLRALARSHVHVHILHVSFRTWCFDLAAEVCLPSQMNNSTFPTFPPKISAHIQVKQRERANTAAGKYHRRRNSWTRARPWLILWIHVRHSCVKTLFPGMQGNMQLISCLWDLHHRQPLSHTCTDVCTYRMPRHKDIDKTDYDPTCRQREGREKDMLSVFLCARVSVNSSSVCLTHDSPPHTLTLLLFITLRWTDTT